MCTTSEYLQHWDLPATLSRLAGRFLTNFINSCTPYGNCVLIHHIGSSLTLLSWRRRKEEMPPEFISCYQEQGLPCRGVVLQKEVFRLLHFELWSPLSSIKINGKTNIDFNRDRIVLQVLAKLKKIISTETRPPTPHPSPTKAFIHLAWRSGALAPGTSHVDFCEGVPLCFGARRGTSASFSFCLHIEWGGSHHRGMCSFLCNLDKLMSRPYRMDRDKGSITSDWPQISRQRTVK